MGQKKRRRIKKWHIAVAIAAVTIITIGITGSKGKSIEVCVESAQIKDITENIPASGKIKPVIEVKISPDVSGEIVELNFEEGEMIKKGELIMKIKQDVYISMVERAEASLNTVKAQYSQQNAQMIQSELSFQRNKTLFEQKAISQSEFETAQANYEVAKEQLKAAEYNIKSAEASLKEAKENLTKTVIYAPMSGIISKMSVEKGERVVGTSQMAGTEMLRIADFNDMEVLVDVNENDIIRINVGDSAQIEVDAYPSRSFTGVVTHIANSAKNIGSSFDQVTNFEVRILISPTSYQDLLEKSNIPFRPGMSASVTILTNNHPDVTTLPIGAIFTKDGKEFVWVVDENNIVNSKEITTGIQDLNSIEIVSGIESDENVVTSPYSAISKTLTEGTKVKIVTTITEKSKK